MGNQPRARRRCRQVRGAQPPPTIGRTTPPLLDERAEALRQTYVRERELSEEMEFERYEDGLYGGWP
jgi:hypothetical protein